MSGRYGLVGLVRFIKRERNTGLESPVSRQAGMPALHGGGRFGPVCVGDRVHCKTGRQDASPLRQPRKLSGYSSDGFARSIAVAAWRLFLLPAVSSVPPAASLLPAHVFAWRSAVVEPDS